MGPSAPPGGFGLLPAIIAGHFLRPGHDDDKGIAQRLVQGTTAETINLAVATLAKYLEMATKSNRRDVSVYGAVLSLFNDDDLHSFVVQVMKEDTLRNGPLHAAVRFNYFLFTPFLLLDYVFSDTAKGELREALKMFPRDGVADVTVYAARNFDDAAAVIAKLLPLECFRGRVLRAARWTPYNVRRFIDAVNKTLDIPVPPEAKPVYAVVGIDSPVDAFLAGKMEARDFVPMFRSYAGNDEALVGRLLEVVKEKSPFLASLVAVRCGREAIPFVESFVPACTTPFNSKLHSLANTGEIILRDSSNVDSFEFHLKESNYFAVDVHGVSDTSCVQSAVGLISFCFRSKTYFLFPRLFGNVVESVGKILKDNPRPIFVHRWDRFGPIVRRLLDWEPLDVAEVEKVAAEAGETFSPDLMVERVVGGVGDAGGVFCKRASDFSDATVPSSTALRHNAMRVTLVYEFIVKMRRLRERPSEKRSEIKRKRRDREDEGEERHRRKYARGNEGPSRDRRHGDDYPRHRR